MEMLRRLPRGAESADAPRRPSGENRDEAVAAMSDHTNRAGGERGTTHDDVETNPEHLVPPTTPDAGASGAHRRHRSRLGS